MLILSIVGVCVYSLQAQDSSLSLHGRVFNSDGDPVPFATVALVQSNKGTVTDDQGYFDIGPLENTQQTLKVQCVGYKPVTVEISSKNVNTGEIRVILEPANISLHEAVITAKSQSFQIREQAYQVASFDVDKLQNSNLDVSAVLGRVTGVNIREGGGLGSGYNLSINGLSGKQVKMFLDGIPMDNFGSSYNINNIPINLVDRVEVYKGVVPVWLGSDALGGAVNIITRKEVNNYLDASYSFGSFNTHKAAINGKFVLNPNGLVLHAAAYINHSDNNYQVDDLDKHDDLGNVIGSMSTTRFHDAYTSAMIQTKFGFVNKHFADKLLIGITLSGNENDVQHGLSLERVFGQVHTKDQILMPSIEFKKKDFFVEGLSLTSYASYIDGKYQVIDTSSREYSWDGTYTIRNNPNIGESDWQKSLFSFNDRTALSVSNASYKINSNEFSLNHTYSLFTRKGNDPFDPDIVPFSEPNSVFKHTFGLSYTKKLFNEAISLTAFGKLFVFDGKTIEEDLYSENTNTIVHERSFRKPGFGFAAKAYLNRYLQVKASFENAYRLPDGPELFGNGLNLISNPLLRPEHSNNLNAGLLFHQAMGKHNWIIESNYFFRDANDLIQLAAAGAKSEYVNLSAATVQGVESEVVYRLNNNLSVTVNGTYQNLINQTKYDENGKTNHTYQDRIPNIPYLFGNLSFTYDIHSAIIRSDKIGFQWNSRYVHEFYLQWPGHGSVKPTIPSQFIHTAEIHYSFKKGMYNVMLGSTNLLDSKAYDNFRIQKPGRSFYLKLRYFIK